MGPNQIAEVTFNRQWVPICGHWFWNNDIGASLFCQKLGFESGNIKNRLTLPSDGLTIGQCNKGDKWLECSYKDCHKLQIGGTCNNGGSCSKGQKAAVSIDCINEGTYLPHELIAQRNKKTEYCNQPGSSPILFQNEIQKPG